jgi:hypothetical protein
VTLSILKGSQNSEKNEYGTPGVKKDEWNESFGMINLSYLKMYQYDLPSTINFLFFNY